MATEEKTEVINGELISRKTHVLVLPRVELISDNEKNEFKPPGSKNAVIYFRRYSIKDYLGKTVFPENQIVDWTGIKQDGIELLFKDEYRDYVPPDWIKNIDFAAMALSVSKSKEESKIKYVEIGLSKIRELRQRIDKPDNKLGHYDLLVQYFKEIVVGWEGIYSGEKQIPFKPEYVDKLPYGIVMNFLTSFHQIMKRGNVELKN